MTAADAATKETDARETPLVELLRAIPATHRVSIPFQWSESGFETGHHLIPVGHLMHRAAGEIDSLRAQLAEAEAELERRQAKIMSARAELAEARGKLAAVKHNEGVFLCGGVWWVVEFCEGESSRGKDD